MIHRQTHRRRAGRRGTVMVEFIACIPLLALVVAATYFFGWSMRNQQRVIVADRYTCWRGFHGTHNYRSEDVSRHYGVQDWAGFLDTVFFNRRTNSVGHSIGGGPRDVRLQWIDEARTRGSADAGEVAGDLENGHLPWGRRTHLTADFAATYRIYERLGPGAIGARHGRDGQPWRRGQARLRQTILDLYLGDLDDQISGLDLYEEIRMLYMNGW
ncbi:MAG: hypothetical protein GVY16_10545 [Planctomycetes bacterium]|jgi:hypothetical protein|nr:hypothetical protein [Planctomycetota bacterium]